jgi:hypothetical protein
MSFDYSEILHREKVGSETNIVAFCAANQGPSSRWSNKLPPTYFCRWGAVVLVAKASGKKETFF